MNGKMKAVLIAAVVLGLVASVAAFAAPTLAYMNGDTDQTRDRDMDQTRDRDRLCDCACDMDQTRLQLHLQECAQNGTSLGPVASQYRYQYRHQGALSP